MHIVNFFVYFLITFLPVIVSSWASPFLRGSFLVRVRVFVQVCEDACVFSFLGVFVFSFINSQPRLLATDVPYFQARGDLISVRPSIHSLAFLSPVAHWLTCLIFDGL